MENLTTTFSWKEQSAHTKCYKHYYRGIDVKVTLNYTNSRRLERVREGGYGVNVCVYIQHKYWENAHKNKRTVKEWSWWLLHG